MDLIYFQHKQGFRSTDCLKCLIWIIRGVNRMSRDFGFDPHVKEYVDIRLAGMDLTEEQRRQIAMLFMPLSAEQFSRLLPKIEMLLSQLEGDIKIMDEGTNPKLSMNIVRRRLDIALNR